MTRCLGARIADLADGRLEPAEAERAFAHIAVCLACREALAAQRMVISELDRTSPAEPSSDLLGRLRAISAEPPAPLAASPQGGAGSHPRGGAGSRPSGSRPTGPAARRRRGRVVVASAAGAAVLAVALVVGGSSAITGAVAPGPAIAPVVDTLTDEHAARVDQMPLSGPRIVTVGYVDPSAAPSSSPQP